MARRLHLFIWYNKREKKQVEEMLREQPNDRRARSFGTRRYLPNSCHYSYAAASGQLTPLGPWGVTTPSGHFSPFAETISALREENIISRAALSVMYDRGHARRYIEPLNCTRESTARHNDEQTTLGVLR